MLTPYEWRDRGRFLETSQGRVFILDIGTSEPEGFEPLVVIHGFPTSSYDFAAVVDRLARRRRVVLIDLPGYGYSEKADRAYTMDGQATAVSEVLTAVGISRCALLTHDMGDTVGGELLARAMEGVWDVEVTRRVVTNGSIYIEMAQLTDGQQFLLALPDELAPADHGATTEMMAASLAATLAPAHRSLAMTDHADLVMRADGWRLLPRLIRYIEERRAHQARYTGAIEAHPSPLTVVWGPEDPIAVAAMAEQLCAARPDATLRWIDGAGHYPQIENPGAWLDAVVPAVE